MQGLSQLSSNLQVVDKQPQTKPKENCNCLLICK